MLLLLFTPEYFLFITPNTLSTSFLLEYASFLNVFILNLLYPPCLKLDLTGIWSDAFISSFMQVLIAFELYALSAIMNYGLYFFKLFIDAITNLPRVLLLLLLVNRVLF